MENEKAKHAPVPWKVISYDHGDFAIVDAHGDKVAVASAVYPECTIGIDKDDAYRIVACVNACESVSNEVLE